MSRSDSVSVRVPVRIDFAGGWSDVPLFSAPEGGAVLNAAIDRFVEGAARWGEDGLRVEYGLDLPAGSGLGASGALDVAWLALTNRLIGRQQWPVELAEGAYRLEKLLGVRGGKQDQYAAALGGFNLLTFGAEDEPAGVERLRVPPDVIRELEARCVLCYSGSAHSSDAVHGLVWERYVAGNAETADALRRIRNSARPARDALLAGDLDALAEVVTLNREQARRLHPGLVTARLDELFAVGAAVGALGSKACGAGGGGCVLFLCPTDGREAVAAALARRGAEMIAFRFYEGAADQSS